MPATQAQIDGGKAGRQSIEFENVVAENKNGVLMGDALDIWGQRKTKPKTDVLTENHNYSVKNPDKASTSTQIQVCSVDRFCRLFGINGSLKIQFNQFFGNHGFFKNTGKDKGKFQQHCINQWNIDPSKLDPKNEIRRCRLLLSSVPEGDKLLNWFQDNMESVLTFVFKTSFNNPANIDAIADTILWVEEKDNYSSKVEINIDTLIRSIVSTATVKIRDHKRFGQSVIEIGPVTLQMKGSGHTASAYHSMQFNASLNDIKKYV